ncbi:calcium-transporting ATPase [Lactarius indigo]|nr:calcium-transporting ATPase [Lactarius indigo]
MTTHGKFGHGGTGVTSWYEIRKPPPNKAGAQSGEGKRISDCWAPTGSCQDLSVGYVWTTGISFAHIVHMVAQIAIVDVQEDNNSGPLVASLASPDNTVNTSLPLLPIGHPRSPPGVPAFLALHTSDPSFLHPPPSSTLPSHSSSSIFWVPSTVLRENNTKENDGSSSLGLTLSSQGHRRMGSTSTVPSLGSNSTYCDIAISSNFGIIPETAQILAPNGAELTHPAAVLDLKQEVDLNVGPFAFKPLQLAVLVDFKDLESFESLGGVERPTPPSQLGPGSPDPGTISSVTSHGVEMASLKPNTMITSLTDVSDGLQNTASLAGGSGLGCPAFPKYSADAYEVTMKCRQDIYGQNILTRRPSKGFLLLMWLALQNKVIVFLSTAAYFSTTRPEGDSPVACQWVEGVAIIAAILIAIAVGSLSNWKKEKQFKAFNAKKEDRLVKVIRDGRERQIPVHQIVVGDVALLEPGEVIPCDGVFLSGHNVRCDESSATGEPDAIKKLSYEECIALRDQRRMRFGPDGPSGRGGKGIGSYVVISVGTKSFNGRITMASRGDVENTPLQSKMNDLAEAIAKIGSIAGGLFFVALLIRYSVQPEQTSPQRTPNEEGTDFVRTLGSCETMANASVICTNKTGTLTQNEMTVIAGSVGVHAKFERRPEENRERTGNEVRRDPHAKDFGVDLADLNANLPDPLKELFNGAIAICSTAFEEVDPESGAPVFIGGKTETALLEFAKELGWPNYKHTRDSADVIQMIPFSGDRKSMGCVVRLPDGSYRLYTKGASEVMARKCTRHVVVYRDTANEAPSGSEVETAPIGETEGDNISRTIASYASQALRTVALCYRDFPYWPPHGARLLDRGEASYPHPYSRVQEAVANCDKAGVRVKMSSRVPLLRDKRILVETLKELGEVVGVTGKGTNDEPALKAAHVGFSMGVAGTEVAKEASDIVLTDDDFSSIVSANITAIVVVFVWALASKKEGPILNAIQLLWINPVIGTFAAVALATDPASPALLDRKPGKKTDPLITVNMTKQILGQVVYQIIAIIIFHFFGWQILGVHHTDDPTLQKHHDDLVRTLVFNVFVFAQVFNSFNCRRLDRKLNIFEGVSKNWYFMAIITIEVAVQALICSIGGSTFGVTRMGAREWCISVTLGFCLFLLALSSASFPTSLVSASSRNYGSYQDQSQNYSLQLVQDAEPGLHSL